MLRADLQQLLVRAAQLRRTGQVDEAIAAYRLLLSKEPNLPDSWYNLGWLLRHARQFEPALEAYGEALARGVRDPEEVHLNRAAILSDHLARPDESEAELRRALAINPDYTAALLNLGNLFEDRGDRAAATDAYQQALDRDPTNVLALSRLAGVTEGADATDEMIGRLKSALADSYITLLDRSDAGFALGRLLDASGRFDEAFSAYTAANEASRASLGPTFSGYDAAEQEQLVDRLMTTFASSAVDAPSPSDPPIFICGMFRSGSTLTERILAAHSQVEAGGELDLLPSIVRSLEPYPEAVADPAAVRTARDTYLAGLAAIRSPGKLVTDKRPDNFLHIGLIKSMFPDAKVVHTHRNPPDNILSLYFLQLDPSMAYALDLADATHWYEQYVRLMEHWRRLYGAHIFDVDYDELVADPGKVARDLVRFCGLEWEDACLAPHLARGTVKTASVWQVREPLHQRASGRWRNYQAQLEQYEVRKSK